MSHSTIIHLLLASGILFHGAFHGFRRRSTFALNDLALCMTAAFFGIGPWLAFFYGRGTLPEYELVYLLKVYACLDLYLWGLAFVRRLAPLFGFARKNGQQSAPTSLFDTLKEAGRISPTFLISVYGSVWGIRLLLGLRYGIFVSGTATAENMEMLPYLVFAAATVLEVVAYACVLWASTVLWTASKRRGFAGALLLLELMWMSLQGRRWILALITMVFLGYLATSGRLRLRVAAVGAAVVFVLVVWLFPGFASFRDHYLRVYTVQDALPSIGSAVRSMSVDDVQIASQQHILRERPLIVGFNLAIAEGQAEHGLMMGQALLNALVRVIPSVFYPAKTSQILQPEEQVQTFYNVRVKDTSSNWPAYGMADLGIIGGLAAGLLVGGIMLFVQWLAATRLPVSRFLTLCMLGGMIMDAAFVEETPVHLFSTLRVLVLLNLVLWLPAVLLRSGLPRRRSKPVMPGTAPRFAEHQTPGDLAS
jgi:hypothetical protein